MSYATVDAVVVAPAAGLLRTFRQLRIHPGNRVLHIWDCFSDKFIQKNTV